MLVEVIAPNRIDLAGGTTDLYPVYLFMDGGFTVNASISVKSFATIQTLDIPEIRISSVDLGETAVLGLHDDWEPKGPLSLAMKALKAFPPACGLEIVTKNDAPAGSGLGASSALLIALTLGLEKIRTDGWSKSQIIHHAADVETSLIGVPAGKQDHIAALYGGVSYIEFGFTGFVRRGCASPEVVNTVLEEMIVLSYTGEGRFSGMNNWDITRNVIEKTGDVKQKLIEIRDIASNMATAINERQWDEVGRLIDCEWTLRRSLAPGVSTGTIDSIMAAARDAGALASKICGAGGGGCMISMVKQNNRARVEKAISDAGGKVIPFQIMEQGANVTIRK